MLAVVEQLGIERPIVIGHSAGAIYAVLLAGQVPVTSLVLEAPVLRGGPPPLPGFRRWGPPLLRAGRPLVGRALGTAWHGRPPAATVEAYRAATRDARWAEAMVELTLAPRPADVTALVATLDVPVLVVAGEHDRFSRGDLGRPVVVVAGAGHVPHEERPDAFLAALSPLVEV
jgi:pimeloyl-ACP methyl ester carboxylesterase